MYTIFIRDGLVSGSPWQRLHNPMRDQDGLVVIDPVLTEELNTHGSLTFNIAQTNPMYGALRERTTLVKVTSDTKNRRIWFGRIMTIERALDNVLSVYCEGELAFLCDSSHRPFGFKGSPEALFTRLINGYNGSRTLGPTFVVGNVSVTDPNDYIVRSSNTPATVWDRMRESLFNSSLGGYIMPRYDEATDTHYIDYLALDDNDQFSHTSSQIVKFGSNLIKFRKSSSAADIVTALIPFGTQLDEDDPDYEAGPPENGSWNGNRLTIASVNSGQIYIDNTAGQALWGRIVGTKIWDDVTIASNLLTKAQSWLAQQVYANLTLEVSAIDLAYVDADIEQIQVGDYVRVQSKPHDINALLLCTKKTTALTNLANSDIILGAGLKTITDLQAQK